MSLRRKEDLLELGRYNEALELLRSAARRKDYLKKVLVERGFTFDGDRAALPTYDDGLTPVARALLWEVRSAKDGEEVVVPTEMGDRPMVRLSRRTWEDVETGADFEHKVVVNAATRELKNREEAKSNSDD